MIRKAHRHLEVALVLTALLAAGCRAENLDHCVHRAEDADAWCSVNHSGTPYCSPCAAMHNGCVAEAPSPDECALLSPEPETTSASASSSSSSGTSSTSG